MRRKSSSWIIAAITFSELAVLAGCASGKQQEESHPETAPFVSDVVANPVPVAVELATDLNHVDQSASQENTANTAKASDEKKPSETSEESSAEEQKSGAKVVTKRGSGKTITYVVKSGDTLMKIAFEHLGDLLRWREIYADNKEKIGNINSLKKGTSLTIHVSNPVKVTRNGDPYAIRKGDTLGKISNWLYGTFAKWQRLWKNNRELIHNPNRIYAGFRLYYTMTPEERANFKRLRELPEIAPKPLAQGAATPDMIGPMPVPVPIPESRAPASSP